MRSAAALTRASERSEHVGEVRAADVRTHRKERKERAGRAARRDLLKREERK